MRGLAGLLCLLFLLGIGNAQDGTLRVIVPDGHARPIQAVIAFHPQIYDFCKPWDTFILSSWHSLFLSYARKLGREPNLMEWREWFVKNGSFERCNFSWMLFGKAEIVPYENAPHRKHVLQCTVSGDMAVQVVIAQSATQYAVSVWMGTEKVKPISGAGYAYAAVYEFDLLGNLLAFRDFAQLTGTNAWQKFNATWTTQPKTFYFEVRLGLYNAQGIALFDAVQVAKGAETPGQYIEPSEPKFVKGKVALILHDLSLPQNPAAPSPEVLSRWLREAGYEPKVMTMQKFAEKGWDEVGDVGLLVLPNSPYFLVEAHRNLLWLLTNGIDLLTFGGYAFDAPMQFANGSYQPIQLEKPVRVELLNVNPDFETVKPNGSAEDWERSHPRQCFVTKQVARIGEHCATVQIPDELAAGSAFWRTSVKVQTGDVIRVSGFVKTENVKGSGYAFLAYYPFSGARWVNPCDIAQVRGNSDWQHFSATFVVPYGVDRVEIRFGIYNAIGSAFFDDVRFERIELPPRINSHYGEPRDGLEISPLQIGMFDPHYPLRGAVKLEAEGWSLDAKGKEITGWSAVGVLHRNARWEPIVTARDRFGRVCGTAGAKMYHYEGIFAGSTWVFFGVDSIDLTKLPQFCERVLLPILRQLKQGAFLHNLKSHLACYRPNEPVEVTFIVSNFSDKEFTSQAELAIIGAKEEPTPLASVSVKVPAGETERFSLKLGAPEALNLREGLHRLRLRLLGTSGVVDSMEAGFVVWDGQTFPKSLNFRYSENYFWLNGEPTFMCGTDTWSNWFHSPSQSDPLFWWQQIQMMRDFGLTIFENLQWTPSGYRFSEQEWRQIDAMIYLCHLAGIVYMAGLLIGHDVAIDDETLEQQAQFVTEFARRYRNANGLIYYLNGDYQLRPKKPEQSELGWQVEQTRRWNERLVAAIKSVDPNHPTTSEYYQVPIGGLDLRLTIDGLDVANIGYFDEPQKDLRRFATVFKSVDMRVYGKSLNIGEFGVKTHPAWERDLGAAGYHIRRNELEQYRLFLLLPQYAFGLGASKVQNWCWRDDDDQVFPWGLVYPCDNVPKPALKAYRTAALVLRKLKPVWRKPDVLLVVSDSSRLLPKGTNPWHPALVAASTLVRLRADFAVASDLAINDELLNGVKAVFLPGALTVPTETEETLKRFVERGGIVYRSGVGGDPAREWEVADFSIVDKTLREHYRQILTKANVLLISSEPDLPTLHAFSIPLKDGVAFVFVNASDEPVTFTAHLLDGSSIRMGLDARQPGLIAVDKRGRVFVAEGSGQIFVNGELVAEGNGHFAVIADGNSDLREAEQLWLFPTEATTITFRRHLSAPKPKTAEVGEWRDGKWTVLEQANMSLHPDAVNVKIAHELKGEVVLLK